MSQITIDFDNNLTYPDIVIPLVHSSEDEAGENYKDNQTEIQQTSVYGIMTPLIKINNVVIDFTDVIDFSLKSKYNLPSLSITVRDKYDLIKQFDVPGSDNIVQVQILPRFDNAYKKINLMFYLSNIRNNNGFITATGIYKLPKLTASNYKSFGEINTYDLFSEIAKDTKLGLATNIEANDSDKRFVYCDYKSYLDIMDYEITHAGYDLQICDYWIDFWNNINLVDIYERYNAIDPDDQLKIWVSGQNKEITEGNKPVPIQIHAILNNHPGLQNTELYIQKYERVNKTGQQSSNGTDRVYSSFNMNNNEYQDYLIQDGDVKKDIFTKFEYVGECYGETDYFLTERKRKDLLQKIAIETIEVTLKTPLLALMRGHKINMTWYINDSKYDNKQENLKEDGVIQDVETVVQTDQSTETISNPDNGHFVEDKSVCGQYLITSCDMKYSNNEWNYILTLSRPASHKPQIIKEEK